MCCLPSVILSISLAWQVLVLQQHFPTPYWGENGYAWFRPTMLILAAIFVLVGLVIHFRSRGICTLDQAKRARRKIINTSLLVIIISYISYLLLNYVILTEIGILLDLPWKKAENPTCSGNS